jgi:hypothetical protein
MTTRRDLALVILGLLAMGGPVAAQAPRGRAGLAPRLDPLGGRLGNPLFSGHFKAATPPGPQVPRPAGPIPQPSPLAPGYHPVVRVLAPGSLDWTIVVSPWSLDPAPTLATAGYVSTRQAYELYVPPGHDPRQPYGMILHVSTGPRSDGWVHWRATCERRGLILAGVHGAGNDAPKEARARAVLDVLDDVRRRYPVDPDRTYITGISGAGHAASSIAFALPEVFGGVIAICGAWNLRVDPMLRLRVRDRLSVAMVTGATDFNRREMEAEFFPILVEEGIRSRLWVFPGMGHACPPPAQLDQIFLWTELGLMQRRLSGALFPASRRVGPVAPETWAAAVLQEGTRRLELPGGERLGVFLLHGVAERWKGLPAAEAAEKALAQFDASSPVSSAEIYRTERLRFRHLQARQFDGTLNAPPPPGYPVPRINLVRIGIALWGEVHELAATDSPMRQEAAARLAALRKAGGG